MEGVTQTADGGLKRFFGAIGNFIKKHKVLSIIILIVVVLGLAALIFFTNMNAAAQAEGVTIQETTVLSKMDLELTVTATGTLQSGETREVSSTLSYDVEEIYVEEGDIVSVGQILCVLDDEELEDKIADIREDIVDADASDSKTLSRLATALQEARDQQTNNLNANQAAADSAYAAWQQAISNSGTTASKLNTATADLENQIYDQLTDKSIYAEVKGIRSESDLTYYMARYPNAFATSAQTIIKHYLGLYSDAAKADSEAQAAISTAKSTYDKAEETKNSTYSNDAKSIESAQQSYDDQAAKGSAEDLREQLADYIDQRDDLTITAPISGTITSLNAKVGNSAGGSTSAGGSATAGSALFVIENADLLEIPVSVAEYDAIGITKGMSATVTTDALEDLSWEATVTNISPTVSSGYFTVMVQITSPVGDLTIGMSATADIIIESVQDVYAVPYDAVVTNSEGQTVVYALDTSGMGGFVGRTNTDGAVDMGEMPEGFEGEMPEGDFSGGERPEGMPDFSGTTGATTDASGTTTEENRIEIVVTTGLETDYYIEISGEGLYDGLLILNDPLGLNVNSGSTALEGDFSLGGMGNMGAMGGEVTVATMPSGGGNMPEGGPSGGGNGGPPSGG